MTPTIKIIIAASTIVVIGLLSFAVYKQVEISNRQLAIESEVLAQKNLVDGIVRSQTEYVNRKDIERFITDNNNNLKAIQDDMKKLHAEILSANSVVAVSKGYTGSNIPSTGSGTKNPNPVDTTSANTDTVNNIKEEKRLSLNEDFGTLKVPIGSVGFSAWQPNPWSLDIMQREYHLDSVTGVDENQKQYVYNKFTLQVDGKSYELPIKAETQQVYPEAKFSWWNPRLFLGIDSGVAVSPFRAEVAPGLSVGFMSYGKFLNQPDFSILNVGLSYGMVSQSPQLSLAPITYNLGKHIPLMNNLYVGPSLQLGLDKEFLVMIGFRVAL